MAVASAGLAALACRGLTIPEPAPEPQRLIFVSGRTGNSEIYIVSVNGGDEIQLTHTEADEFAPELSPDGRTIVYWVRDKTASPPDSLWFMRSDGSQAAHFGPGSGRLSWSPDGTQIIFSFRWQNATTSSRSPARAVARRR
jgi:TolB protein